VHEFAIAQSILERALAEAEKHEAKKICTLGVRLGKASHITPDSLEFCFKAVAKGTIAEGAKVEVEPLELKARCRQCGREFSAGDDHHRLVCPCGSQNVQVISGDEVYLENLTID
jgi:hydrogenase nickel incorporation protein HypA/HybF